MTLQGTWVLDPAHSEAGFTVRHAGISKVRGSFPIMQASVNHDGTAARVSAVLDATSFTTGNEDRDAHIKSADFLEVETYPTINFDGVYEAESLTGDLTIHGVTLPVSIPVEEGGVAVDPFGNTRAGFDASITIDRRDFGLTWNAVLDRGGLLVSEKVKVELSLSFIKTD